MDSENFTKRWTDLTTDEGILFFLVTAAINQYKRRYGMDVDASKKSFRVFLFFLVNPNTTVAQMASVVGFDRKQTAQSLVDVHFQNDSLTRVGFGLKNNPYRYSVSPFLCNVVYREVLGEVDAARKTVKSLKLDIWTEK